MSYSTPKRIGQSSRAVFSRAWKRMAAHGFAAVALVFAVPAADKNGVSPGSVSLPKGPGSIEGLGESFQPVLHSQTRLAARHQGPGHRSECLCRIFVGCAGGKWTTQIPAFHFPHRLHSPG